MEQIQYPDLAELKVDEGAQDKFFGAFSMTLARLRDNEMLQRGEQPEDPNGNPTYPRYMSESQIREFVTRAYGDDRLALDAIKAAYSKHYEELLEERTT
ncbi:MAG TPA: hypothetical protein VF261_02715 [Candidatus Saccharimonadales bacterium]